MGIAEVIPGVSGGTIAFITGIYERLLSSIRNIDGSLFKHIFTGQFSQAFNKVDGAFLIRLMLGMLLGIVVGIFGVTYLLDHFPTVLWSFFFGLILMSVFYILSKRKQGNVFQILIFILGVIVALGICILNPIDGSANPLYLVLAGSIAISALILPGISGSFMLLILGMYSLVIPALKNLLVFDFSMGSIKIVGFFAVGCIIGLALFSRVLSWTFKHYHDQTLALLSGFMLGSLYKIWPWRHPSEVLDKLTGKTTSISAETLDLSILHNEQYKVLSEKLVGPMSYIGDSLLVFCILASIAGVAVVFLLWNFDSSDSKK